MGHSMTSGMLAATLAQVMAPIVFVEIDTPAGNVYLWTGYGNIIWNSQTWLGGGNLLDVGSVTEQNTVSASGTALTLSGVNQAYIAVVLEDLQRYYPAKLWLGALDDMFDIIADPYQFMNGRVDRSDITLSGDSAKISVNVESRLVTMRIPKVRRYTDLDQRIEHPNDGGFTYVDTIQDAAITFGG